MSVECDHLFTSSSSFFLSYLERSLVVAMKSLSYIGLGASLASAALADEPLKHPFRGGNGGSAFSRRQDDAPLVSPVSD